MRRTERSISRAWPATRPAHRRVRRAATCRRPPVALPGSVGPPAPWQSVTISGHQWPSVAISGHQWQSVAIVAISGHHLLEPRVKFSQARCMLPELRLDLGDELLGERRQARVLVMVRLVELDAIGKDEPHIR